MLVSGRTHDDDETRAPSKDPNRGYVCPPDGQRACGPRVASVPEDPRSLSMFHHRVDENIELRLIDRQHAEPLFALLESNREYLSRWHPWVDLMRSTADVEKGISAWKKQHANHRGFQAGVWFRGQLCGMVGHAIVDWPNRWMGLTYWLDAGHQGRGIMTACCRALIVHAFEEWDFNRVSIECAVENRRSRGVPERLGFKLEGIVGGVERLHDRFVDHALYGLLRSDYRNAQATRTP